MINIQLSQNAFTKTIGLVQDQDQAQALIQALGQVCPVQEDQDSYYIEKKDLANYSEIDFNGHKIPLSRFEFPDQDPIYIDAQALVNLAAPGNGLDDTYAVIENYAIPYQDLKTYLEKREAAYKRIKKALEDRGYQVDRFLQGSEDGEAIVMNKDGQDQWYFAALDPAFVEDMPEEEEAFQDMVDDYLQE